MVQEPALKRLRTLRKAEDALRTAIVSMEPGKVEQAVESAEASGCRNLNGQAYGLWLIKLPTSHLLKLQLLYALHRAPLPAIAVIMRHIKARRLAPAAGQEQQEAAAPSTGLRSFSGLRPSVTDADLTYSPHPLTQTLTNLDPTLTTLGLRVFRLDVLGVEGGEKARATPAEHRGEVVRLGRKIPGIVDEVFCQVLKQLTATPSEAATAALWELLAGCIRAFAPSPALENILETFLMAHDRADLADELALALLARDLRGDWRAAVAGRGEGRALLRVLTQPLPLDDDIQRVAPPVGPKLEADIGKLVQGARRLDKPKVLALLNGGGLPPEQLQVAWFMVKGSAVSVPPGSKDLFSKEELDAFWRSTVEPRFEDARTMKTIDIPALAALLRHGAFELELTRHYDLLEVSTLPAVGAAAGAKSPSLGGAGAVTRTSVVGKRGSVVGSNPLQPAVALGPPGS
jgi:hypothetical protein